MRKQAVQPLFWRREPITAGFVNIYEGTWRVYAQTSSNCYEDRSGANAAAAHKRNCGVKLLYRIRVSPKVQ